MPLPLIPLKHDKKLVVAWDFDQCLDKVVNGGYAVELGPFAKAVVLQYALHVGANVVELVSFSNRISDFYNDVVQPEKGWRPNIQALVKFATLIEDECTVTVNHDYQIDGDELFAKELGLTPAAYNLEKANRTPAFIKKHTSFVASPVAKQLMMNNIVNNTSADHILFVDDKFDNLSLDSVPIQHLHKCKVLHFHASKIAVIYPATQKRLKEPKKFAKEVLADSLGIQEWFAVT